MYAKRISPEFECGNGKSEVQYSVRFLLNNRLSSVLVDFTLTA